MPANQNSKQASSIFRDMRGAAAVEAVILLPFFILIFAGLIYMERVWESKQVALLTARRCAWEYSNNGCRGAPAGCERFFKKGDDPDIEGEFVSSGVLDTLDDVPLLGSFIDGFFGSAVNGYAEQAYERPPMFGGGDASMKGHYYLMCNEKYRELDEVIWDAFRNTVGDVF